MNLAVLISEAIEGFKLVIEDNSLFEAVAVDDGIELAELNQNEQPQQMRNEAMDTSFQGESNLNDSFENRAEKE